MANNTFQTKTEIKKAIAFQWKAFTGFTDRLTFRNDELPSAVDNTGASVKLRRPSRYTADQVAVGGDYSLGSTAASLQPFTYKVLSEDVVDFTVAARFEINLQVSMEDLMFKLDKKDAMDRHITPAIIGMRNKINQYVSGYVEAFTGASLVSDGTGDGILKSLFDAKALLESRGAVEDGQSRTVLFNKKVMPTLALRAANIFQAKGAGNTYSSSKFEPIAGFDLYESPLLTAPTIAAIGTTVTVLSAGLPAQNAWTQTFSVTVDGLTAGTLKAGTKFKFKNGSTYINWLVPTVGVDAGYVATFTLVQDTVVDGTGDVLVLSEPLISTGDKANVTAALVAGSVMELATNTGLIRPSYAFGESAVVLGSPKVNIPSGVSFGENMKFGGFNIALIEDHWPGSLQNITKLVAFIAVAVPQPEGIVALY